MRNMSIAHRPSNRKVLNLLDFFRFVGHSFPLYLYGKLAVKVLTRQSGCEWATLVLSLPSRNAITHREHTYVQWFHKPQKIALARKSLRQTTDKVAEIEKNPLPWELAFHST